MNAAGSPYEAAASLRGNSDLGPMMRTSKRCAKLSRRLGGWQVISWVLVLSAPVMLVLTIATLPISWEGIGTPAWLGLAYVSVFSMLVGFVFWYRGLALGGIAGGGQLQLLQPFSGLALAGLLLGAACRPDDDRSHQPDHRLRGFCEEIRMMLRARRQLSTAFPFPVMVNAG